MEEQRTAIRPRDRDAAIQALRAGIVPRTGLQHIQVGRSGEVGQVVKDMERIKDGGSAVRFVIGDYGAGKTFFLNLARSVALQAGLVVAHADLTPDRRLHSSGGHARALAAELIRNLSTRTKPDGGALGSVVERFLGGDDMPARFEKLREGAGGHDMAAVVAKYGVAADEGDDDMKSATLRWLRAEFNLKTEAREALGVRRIPDDDSVHDHLKGIALLSRLAGYSGMLVIIDECVNLYKLNNSIARSSNYEQILRILNDTLGGTAGGIGFYFGGTPEFLMDGRRGLWSYEALRSRLAENSFAGNGLIDLSGPVLRLQNLTPEEFYVLLSRLRALFPDTELPEEAQTAFMEYCARRVGNSYFRTPRTTIKGFLDLLSVLEQNPGTDWTGLLNKLDVKADIPAPDGDDAGDDEEELKFFRA